MGSFLQPVHCSPVPRRTYMIVLCYFPRLTVIQMFNLLTSDLIFIVVQRSGPEETHLPEDGLLRTFWQEGVPLGGPKDPQLLEYMCVCVCECVSGV